MEAQSYMQLFLWAGGMLTGVLGVILLIIWRRTERNREETEEAIKKLRDETVVAIQRLDRVVFDASGDPNKVRLASIHQLNNYRQELVMVLETIRPLAAKMKITVPVLEHTREDTD